MVWVGRKGLLLIGVVRQILNNDWTEVRYGSVSPNILEKIIPSGGSNQ